MATFYDVPNTEFVWHGEWNDPEIIYKGFRINYYTIENSLWESFNELCDDAGHEANSDDFVIWISQNHDEVYEYLDMAIQDVTA